VRPSGETFSAPPFAAEAATCCPCRTACPITSNQHCARYRRWSKSDQHWRNRHAARGAVPGGRPLRNCRSGQLTDADHVGRPFSAVVGHWVGHPGNSHGAARALRLVRMPSLANLIRFGPPPISAPMLAAGVGHLYGMDSNSAAAQCGGRRRLAGRPHWTFRLRPGLNSTTANPCWPRTR